MLRHWSQFVPNMSTNIRGHEALPHHHQGLICYICVFLVKLPNFDMDYTDAGVSGLQDL